MYDKINRKITLFKRISFLINVVLIMIIIFVLYLLFSLYFIHNNRDYKIKNVSIVSDLIEKPKLQAYDKEGKIVLITADKAKIIDNSVTAFDVKITSKNLNLNSKIVDLDNENDEIIFKNRPMLIFYENKSNSQ